MSTPRASGAGPFDLLSADLTRAFEAWNGEPWDEELLDDWARRAFGLQFEGNRPYRRYCEARGVAPGDVGGWREFPPVPTAAFRVVDLIVGSPAAARLTFLTSGTTRGPAARGRHLLRAPELYRAALRSAFRILALGGNTAAKIVTLPPSFALDPGSSLGWMLDDLRVSVGSGDGVGVAASGGIEWGVLDHEMREADRTGRPLCLLGTTLGFAEWLDRLREGRSAEMPLPAGSVVMDTGGEKGRPGLSRAEVLGDLAPRLGIPSTSLVNEFGMTELLSQRYGVGVPAAPLVGPPWLRSRVLHPVTLNEVPDGETGILSHFDLANLGSVCAVLTEDQGRIVDDGIEWIGRTEGAPPRGCSLATAELLEAQSRA